MRRLWPNWQALAITTPSTSGAASDRDAKPDTQHVSASIAVAALTVVLTTIVFTFSITGVAFIFQAYFAGMAIFIDSVHEIETATTLKKNIKAITLKRKIYGVASE